MTGAIQRERGTAMLLSKMGDGNLASFAQKCDHAFAECFADGEGRCKETTRGATVTVAP